MEKGLALEPRHPLLRTSAGYQQMRIGNLDEAIEILEGVIRDDESLRIAVPTLALCYVQAGERERAAALLKDDTLAAAEADSEMAYRLATLLCGGRRLERGAALAAPGDLSGQRKLSVVPEESGVEQSADKCGFRADSRRLEKEFPQKPEDLEAAAGAGAAGGGIAYFTALGAATAAPFPSAYFKLTVAFKGRLCEEPPTRMV